MAHASCLGCGASVEVTDELPGSRTRCGACGAMVEVPRERPRSAPPLDVPVGYRTAWPAERPAGYRTSAPARRCPRCDGGLGRYAVAGSTVELCGGCGGLFVEPAALSRLSSEPDEREAMRRSLPGTDVAAAGGEPVRYLRCPTCSQLMSRRNFAEISGVIIDVCAQHGSWLDAGELQRIATFVEQGGLERAARRRAEERKERERGARRRVPVEPPLTRAVTRSPAERTETLAAAALELLAWLLGG